MTDSFSAELWRGIADIYVAILAHPFMAGLTDGSLPPEAFAFYLVHGALFLRRYAQALAVVAGQAPDTAGTEMFARHAAGIVTAEMSLHESLLADLNMDAASVGAAQEAPTTLAYTSYLLATARGGSYGEGVGAVLPCYWIYWQVGKHLLGKGSPNRGYQQWIDTYGAGEFGAEALEVIAVTDKLGLALAPVERERIRCHFRVTSRYEWMFWDMGFRRENWPL